MSRRRPEARTLSEEARLELLARFRSPPVEPCSRITLAVRLEHVIGVVGASDVP